MNRHIPAIAPVLAPALALLLAACGTPAVLRGPPGAASMPAPAPSAEAQLPPLPAIVEPTGDPRIVLPIATQDGFTPTSAPRSGRAERP